MKAQELRDLALQWLLSSYPGALIVPELSLADYGGALVDLAAITETEIVGVEIKGEGDSPSRLELQGLVYGRVCRRMWLLADASIEETCQKRRPAGWGRLEVFDGAVRPFNRATKLFGWQDEKTTDGIAYKRSLYERDNTRYDPDTASESCTLCPQAMCETLWRDELYEIARRFRLNVGQRAYVHHLTAEIIKELPLPVIHAAMIRALRERVWRGSKASLNPKRVRERSLIDGETPGASLEAQA